jgi:hypothetical protein
MSKEIKSLLNSLVLQGPCCENIINGNKKDDNRNEPFGDIDI